MPTGSLQRIYSVARKEAVHIRRDPVTFFFALMLPMLQMFMLGRRMLPRTTILLDRSLRCPRRAMMIQDARRRRRPREDLSKTKIRDKFNRIHSRFLERLRLGSVPWAARTAFLILRFISPKR